MTIVCEKARGLEVAWSGDVPRLVPSAGGIVHASPAPPRVHARDDVVLAPVQRPHFWAFGPPPRLFRVWQTPRAP